MLSGVHGRDLKKTNYVLSEDPEFNVVRLTKDGKRPYIQIVDKTTGRVYSVTPEKYHELFTGCYDELVRVLNALIRQNSAFSKAEFVAALTQKAEEEIAKFRGSLHVLNFIGYSNNFPIEANVGDMTILNSDDCLYICVSVDELTGTRWKKVLCDGDLYAYYTKEEFDEKYVSGMELISSYVNNTLDISLERSEEIFLKKTEADERLSAAYEYRSAIIVANDFVAEQQEKVNNWYDNYQRELSALQYVPDQYEEFLEEQRGIIADSLAALSAKVDNEIADFRSKVSGIQAYLDDYQAQLNRLSGEYNRAVNGRQKVLDEGRSV